MTDKDLQPQQSASRHSVDAQRPTVKRVTGDGRAWYVKRPWGWEHIGPADLTAHEALDAAIIHLEKPL